MNLIWIQRVTRSKTLITNTYLIKRETSQTIILLKDITSDETLYLCLRNSVLVNFTIHEKSRELQVSQWEYFVWRLLMSKAAVKAIYFP